MIPLAASIPFRKNPLIELKILSMAKRAVKINVAAFTFSLLLSALLGKSWAQTEYDWTWRNPLPNAEFFEEAVWTGSRIAAVGPPNAVLLSPDGREWSPAKLPALSPAFSHPSEIVWTGKALVTFRTGGHIAKSMDGENWSEITIDAEFMHDLAYGANLLVLVGPAGAIWTSPDAVTWTLRPSKTVEDLHAALWTGREWLVGGNKGTLLTSADGVSWKPLQIGSASGIHHLLMAQDKAFAFTDNHEAFFSADAKTWTAATSPGDRMRAIAWQDSLFVATGIDGAIFTSPDGLTWTDRTIPGNSSTFSHVLHTDQGWLALGYLTPPYASKDGITWEKWGSGKTEDLSGIVKGHDQMLAIGLGGSLFTSTDGKAWKDTSLGSGSSFRAIAFANQQFAIVGGRGEIFMSPDGKKWTRRETGVDGDLFGLTWTGSLWVAVGRATTQNPGQATIITSPDGVTWTLRPSHLTGRLESVAWSGHRLIAVGTATAGGLLGAILSSPDGVTWSKEIDTFEKPFHHVVYANRQFLALAENGISLLSSEGSEWQKSVSEGEAMTSAWTGNHWIICTSGAHYKSSPDGITWTHHYGYSDFSVTAMIWTGSELLGVGLMGTIVAGTPKAAGIRQVSRMRKRVLPKGALDVDRNALGRSLLHRRGLR